MAAEEVIFYTLPYIDQGCEEQGVREAALLMVEEETRRFRPTKNYLEHLPPLKLNAFETETMRHEFERIQQRLPMELLSMKRYELSAPHGRMTDIVAWTECVDNSYAQLQHQLTRINNLELLSDYSCEIWKNEVQLIVHYVNEAQAKLQNLRKQIQEVNWARRSVQMQVEILKVTKSPYTNEPPINVFWCKDDEKKAVKVWGSKDNLLKEILRNQPERKFVEPSKTRVRRRRLKYSQRVEQSERDAAMRPRGAAAGLWGPSGRVILSAVLINGCNFIVKFVAWVSTGSHSMFAESIHSLADTVNQLILAYGVHKSVQKPDPDHPYGYTRMEYVSSLISGVGIFCLGTGLSIHHGIDGLLNPFEVDSFYWAFISLAGSLVSEGATCLAAIASLRKGARENGMGLTVKQYVLSGQDPSVNVVLLEDCAALLSIVVTASCIGLAVTLGSPWPDSVGSLLVGGILGVVAMFIIQTNVMALVGRSIPEDFLDKINYELESDVMVRGITDVKSIDMGNSMIRYKAEIDFDGRELTRLYLNHRDLQKMYEQVRQIKTKEEFKSFLLHHCEKIIDSLGNEIDRIEMKLRKKFPQIRHIDLELL